MTATLFVDGELLEDVQADIRDLEGDVDRLERELGAIEEEPQRVHKSPQKITHDFFDPSISQYFEGKNKTVNESSSEEVSCAQTIVSDVLYEGFLRLGGLTAFPINKELWGIRFDVYSSVDRQFLTPHYVILRKLADEKTGVSNWGVYKHTLPDYIPHHVYAGELADDDRSITIFANKVRQSLLRVQYKHEKFCQLEKIVGDVNRDLACALVIIGGGVELTCNEEMIEIVNSQAPQVVYALKNTAVRDLMKNSRPVINILKRKKRAKVAQSPKD